MKQKLFNKTKDRQVFGGRVEEGVIKVGDRVRFIHAGEIAGEGKVTNLQSVKSKVDEVSSVNEFGGEMITEAQMHPGDYFEAFSVEMK